MSIESRRHQYGKVFGHWQIKEFLGSGSGGKSAVFRLEHIESSGVESALKVISLIEERGCLEDWTPARIEEYNRARQFCSERTEREVLLMNDLQGNTNIVDYLDHTFVDWSDETGFGRDMLIRMEKLTDLRGQISTGRQFSREEILKIGRDICTALILCHNRNILHRDIKPENIFINKNGSFKLGDFGISRIVSTTSSGIASTGIGTPQYWAPEQTSGHYDVRVDIYSLGLVLYELSNQNRLPFAQSSYVQEQDVHRRLLGEPLPAPCCADPGLARIILKSCAYRAEDRYQTAEELLYAIQKLSETAQTDRYRTIPAAPSDDARMYQTMPAAPSDDAGMYQTMPAAPSDDARMYRTMPAAPSDDARVDRTMPADVSGTSQGKQQPTRKRIAIAFVAIAIVIAAVFVLKPFSCKEHDWTDATCDAPKVCSKCGETEGDPLEHKWTDATCTTGKRCMNCGKEISAPLGHTWAEATYKAPQTCTLCGTTTGTKLQIDPVYINELSYQDKYGKVYYHDNKHAAYDNNQDWLDQDTPGHVPGLVRDGYGNTFTYGIHLDGNKLGPYYITYEIGGEYTVFSGWCVLPDFMVDSVDALSYSKYFEIYCDGELTFVSDVMSNGSQSQYFEIDVTDVDMLTIQYAASPGRNALALLCDGMLY